MEFLNRMLILKQEKRMEEKVKTFDDNPTDFWEKRGREGSTKNALKHHQNGIIKKLFPTFFNLGIFHIE